MPVAGLEPALRCHKQILSLPRLPFRHTGSLLSQPNFILPYSFVIDKKFLEKKEAFLHMLYSFSALYISTSILIV